MSKTKKEAAKTSTKSFQTDDKGTKIVKREDCKLHEDFCSVPFEKNNPCLNKTAIVCVFGFLSLDEIKNSRFLCQQWNSTAEIYLQKHTKICFRRNGLQLKTFMELPKYSLRNLPYSTYQFSDIDFRNRRSIADLENFFDTLGKNIKEITFENVRLIPAEGSGSNYRDITPWIAKLSNLSSLQLKCQTSEELEISMEKLVPLKQIWLENCIVVINSENYTRPAPSNISLTNVQFKKLGKIIKTQHYNKFFGCQCGYTCIYSR